MAREYFCAYHSYLEAMEPLNDAEKGRLFTACLLYSKTGEAPQLIGNERFVFPSLRGQIDRDEKSYDEFCHKQSENGRKGGRPKKTNEAQKTQAFSEKPQKAKEKENEKDKEKTKDNISPLTPLLEKTGFGFDLQNAFEDWITYKHEKKQGYEPTGLKNLITQVKKVADKYGETSVAELIRDCMASNWQGIIFDRLKNKQQEQQESITTRQESSNPFLRMLEDEYGQN